MSDKFEIIPFTQHATESLPRLFLQKRPGKSPELKTSLSVLKHIGANDYVEIYSNKSKNLIKLVPIEKQTAYSRSVKTDAISWGRIGGASKLVEMGYQLGIYEMTEPLVFKFKRKYPTPPIKGKD